MNRPDPRPDPDLRGAEFRYGSCEDPPSMVDAFRGVDRLLLFDPPTSRRDTIAPPLLPTIAAAGRAGLRHVIPRR